LPKKLTGRTEFRRIGMKPVNKDVKEEVNAWSLIQTLEGLSPATQNPKAKTLSHA